MKISKFLSFFLKVPSLARSVPKPLKLPSLARSVPKPLKVPSLARSVPKPLLIFAADLLRPWSSAARYESTTPQS